jgi:sigma-B regulation protein RsbU (phosphoserine phosphatase)
MKPARRARRARADLAGHLTTLNEIAEVLNGSADVTTALDGALARIVRLMGLESGWIFLKDPLAVEKKWGVGFRLAAHHNLPPALSLESEEAWNRDCDCQQLCLAGKLNHAYNEVLCRRTAEAPGDRRSITVHASVPLLAGDRVLGILNIAAPRWDAFSPEALTLLTNVGGQIGVALERAQLYDNLREQRVRELAVLLELSNQLLSRPQLGELNSYLVQAVHQLLAIDACALLLPDPARGQLVFRAAVGWHSDPVAESRHAPADDTSGPGHVMQTQRPALIRDMENEKLSSWYPDWMHKEGFRGHFILPLIVQGRSIGALMMNSREPRMLEDDELHFLQLMANQAAMAIETARLQEEEIQRRLLEEDLSLARQIQISLLPKSPPQIPGWEFEAFYHPAHKVGGDFFDVFELPAQAGEIEDTLPALGMVVADATDKGMAAALYMALGRTIIRSLALTAPSPAALLMQANEVIQRDSQSGLFLSAFYAILDRRTGRLRFANAGHNLPLLCRAASGKIVPLKGKGVVLGALEAIFIEDRKSDIAPGDSIVFYTDGVTEAMDASHRMFGERRLRAALRRVVGGSAAEVVHTVVEAVLEFVGDTPQSDDITLFVVRRSPPQ